MLSRERLSWRPCPNATQEEQDELDDLLNATLPSAGEMLQRHGEVCPFGASISIDGEIEFFMGDTEHGEDPESQHVFNVLVDGFRERRDALSAIAIASDVRFGRVGRGAGSA